MKWADRDGAHGRLLAHTGDNAVCGNGLLGHWSLGTMRKPDLTVHRRMGQDGLLAIRAPHYMLRPRQIVHPAERSLEEDVRLRMGSLKLGKWRAGEDVPTVTSIPREWSIWEDVWGGRWREFERRSVEEFGVQQQKLWATAHMQNIVVFWRNLWALDVTGSWWRIVAVDVR